jgi:hypothetical protein
MVDVILTRCSELKDVGRHSDGKLPVDLAEGDKYLHCLLSTLMRFPVNCESHLSNSVTVEQDDSEIIQNLLINHPKAHEFWTTSFSTSSPRF